MLKHKRLRSKLQLDSQVVRRLDNSALGEINGGKPFTDTSFLSVLMQCSWYCATASCFVDDTCGMHGCAPGMK